MSKESFLNDLRAAIDSLPEEEKQGVLAYYAEMIDDRIEAGMSEEAAVKAMEPVREIASRVMEESGKGEAGQKTASGNRQDIVRPAGSLKAIHIQAENKRIRFTPQDGTDTVRLRYVIGENDIFRLHEDDGVLTLEHKLRPIASFLNEHGGEGFSLESVLNGVSRFITGLGERILSGAIFNSEAPENEIEVVLPRDCLPGIEASTSNGRVTMSDLTLHAPVRLSTSNAPIQLDASQCEGDIALTTSNSRISINGVSADTVRLTTSNGSVTVSEADCRDSLVCVSSNGGIRIGDSRAQTKLTVTTSNGTIHLESAACPKVILKTSNGSITGTVRGSREDYTVTSSTSNGINRLGSFGAGPNILSAVTSNAAIALDFDGESSPADRKSFD